MKFGILFRWGSWWIGGHWSDHNKRLCVNPVPMVTVWITAEGGETPDVGYGFDIYRNHKYQPKPNIRITNVVDDQLIADYLGKTMPPEFLNQLTNITNNAVKDGLSFEDFKLKFDQAISEFKSQNGEGN